MMNDFAFPLDPRGAVELAVEWACNRSGRGGDFSLSAFTRALVQRVSFAMPESKINSESVLLEALVRAPALMATSE
jgi:hypothetical protein